MDILKGSVEEPSLLLGVDGEEEGDTKRSWMENDDDDLAEDSGADLIIQQVDDSDEELQWIQPKHARKSHAREFIHSMCDPLK